MLVRLINTSISAGWLIAAVLVLRFFGRKRVPRWMICFLWGFAAVRLVCPFSIESPLSLLPRKAVIQESAVGEISPSPLPFVPDSVAPAAADTAAEAAPSPAASAAAKTPARNIWPAATAIWLAGMGVLLTYWLYGYLRLRRTVAASAKVKGNIWICDWIDTPFILGVIRPQIYLPSAMEPEQFSYVLAHEHAHLIRHDHWWKPLGFALLTVYWFNPLIWTAYVLFCRDMELACDERVVRGMDPQGKKRYAEILLSCGVSQARVSVCPVSFGAVGLKDRIGFILRYRKPATRTVVAGGAAAVLLAACFLTDPVEHSDPSAEPSPVRELIVHTIEYIPPSPVPTSVTPESTPRPRPSKSEVLAAREQALEGMTQTQIDRLTAMIVSQNQWWEQKYLENILTRLDNPDDLAWNYFDKTGEIDVDTGVGWSDETGLTGDERAALMERENITIEEFFEKYGTKYSFTIADHSKYSVEEIVSMIGELRDTVQSEDLRTDLSYLANQILWARQTHDMLYVSNMFKLLHDMDYYLLRYGPSDQPSTDAGYGPVSIVSKYYGMLTIFGADHGEGAAPVRPASAPPDEG